MISLFFLPLVDARRGMLRDKFNPDNDPVHNMRELEFRNTIDSYDLAIVLFSKKDSDECKRIITGYRHAAAQSRGRADFIAIDSKHATELIDELGVDQFPTIFAFRHGNLIEKLPNTTQGQDVYYYVSNVTASRVRYIQHEEEAREAYYRLNSTLVIAMDFIDARIDKYLSVVSAKFMRNCTTVIASTPEIAEYFGIKTFPSITLLRNQDDFNITFEGDPTRISIKILTEFVEENVNAKYALMKSLATAIPNPDDLFFACIFEFSNKTQYSIAHSCLDAIAGESFNFPVRYGDAGQLSFNLSMLNLQNFSLPIFGFFKKDAFGYKKWIFQQNPTPNALKAFCYDHVRGRIQETIVDTPLDIFRNRDPLKTWTGSELARNMERQQDKDFVVNFYGYPCKHCEQVDALFYESAKWARSNSVRHVVFATVNASCNDVPTAVWRNESFPYGWMFPAHNRTGAFPIGKRRDLYWMVKLLHDNSTQRIQAPMPPKPKIRSYKDIDEDEL